MELICPRQKVPATCNEHAAQSFPTLISLKADVFLNYPQQHLNIEYVSKYRVLR